MSARIIEFRPSTAGRRRPAVGPRPVVGQRLDPIQPFEFWIGASGERYVHSVFTLIECPELPAANYVLATRDAAGRRRTLRIGRLENDAASLNLAEIRHVGATLGATEVHVHLLAGSTRRRQCIELDLAAAEDGLAQPRAANI